MADKPQLLLLGVAHFASSRNIQDPIILNALLPERQRQVQEVLDCLAKFGPTKIALEVAVDSDTVQAEYQDYLQGGYTLINNEVDQIGYQLAKSLGHTQVYPADSQRDLGFEAVVDYSQQHGQEAIFEQALSDTALLDKINFLRETGTLRDEILYLNTDEALNLNIRPYMILSRIGTGSSYPGADMTAEWYKRNLIIFTNLTRIASSPNDRVLVIFGQGHVALLKQFFGASPDYTLADTEDYLSH